MHTEREAWSLIGKSPGENFALARAEAALDLLRDLIFQGLVDHY